MAKGTGQGQGGPDEIELKALCRREQRSKFADNCMDNNVEPASESKLGRVFPCLQPIATVQVVGGLPVVEDLIAVLDRRIECSKNVHSSEDVEGGYGFDDELILGPWLRTLSEFSHFVSTLESFGQECRLK